MEFTGRYEAEAALVVINEALDADDARVSGLLLDLTESESFRERSADGLRHVAQFLASRRDRFSFRLACVGTTDLAYGLLRMGMVYATDQGVETEVFRTRDEALRWLSRPLELL